MAVEHRTEHRFFWMRARTLWHNRVEGFFSDPQTKYLYAIFDNGQRYRMITARVWAHLTGTI